MGFGQRFQARSNAQVNAAATPPSGNAAEAIWHQLYDTQTFTSAATVTLTFFRAAVADQTLSNMPQGGVLPVPQTLQIYDITLDILSVLPVTLDTAVGPLTTAGVLNDLSLVIFGSGQRPTWTLGISDKNYGPYSLTVLHGTGGPAGWGYGSSIATSSGSIQYARNEPAPGWNYYGNIIIPSQVNFSLVMNWAATATLTANKLLRTSFFGVLNRRVL